MARKPPRITSRKRQPTTRGGPRVTGRTQQPTTGRGRIVRQPSLGRVLAPSWGRPPAGSGGGPAAPATPAAATPAAPAYSVSNLPPDASYDAAVASLQRQRDDQIAQLVQQRAGGLLDYGFTEGPNGALAFDPRNPFSKAALLKKSYDTQHRATGQNLAAGGQQYSGAYQNAQDLVSRNQLQSQDQMQKALQAFLVQNTQRRTAAGTNYELAAQQAYGDRVGRFQSNPLYDPASSQPGAAGAPAGASTAAPAAAGNAPGGLETKPARGYLWAKNSNGTWRKVRPLNAFGH